MSLRAILLFTSCILPLAGNVIFSDNFDGSGTLHGAMPDIRPGNLAWLASPQFGANGNVSGTDGGSATLAFIPKQGKVYTLDAKFTATAIAGNNDWVALGFAKGQSTVAGANERFIGTNVTGRSWMFMRGSATPASTTNSSFLGNGSTSSGGTANGVVWANWTGGTGGTIELRIVIDTTDGPGTWTSTWYAKRPADATYTMVRPTATMLDEDITSVGFARSNTAVTGTLLSFSLSQSPSDPVAPVLQPDRKSVV